MGNPPRGTFKIVSAVDSNAFDAAGGGGKNKTKVLQWIYTGAENQKFASNPESVGFRIASSVKEKKTGGMLVLEEHDGGLCIMKYNGDETQQWTLVEANEDDYVLIKNVATGKCLRNMGFKEQVGFSDEDTGDKSQWWSFVSVD